MCGKYNRLMVCRGVLNGIMRRYDNGGYLVGGIMLMGKLFGGRGGEERDGGGN